MNRKSDIAVKMGVLAAVVGLAAPGTALAQPADPAIAYIAQYTLQGKLRVDLTVANADGSHRTVIWSYPPSKWCPPLLHSPAWSPDLDGNPNNGYQGTIAVAIKHCASLGEPARLSLIDVVVTGGVPQGTNIRDLITSGVDPSVDDPSYITSPEWSPDLDPLTPGYQGTLAFQGALNGVTTVSAIEMYWDGTTAQPVHGPNTSVVLWFPPVGNGPRFPTWSPDGQWLAFTYSDSIYIMEPSTGAIVDIVSGFPSTPGDLQWSRTGSRIGLLSGVGQVFTVDADIGIASLEPVAAGAPCLLRELTWSPDDLFIVFASVDCGNKDKWIIRQTNLANSQVTTLISETGKDLRQPDWRRF
jgi:hypothetical protein